MKYNIFLSALLCLAILNTSCKRDKIAVLPKTGIHLDSSDAVLGRRIVDKDGKSLYFFSNDANGQSNCTGGCSTIWPVFYVDSATATFSQGLSASDFKTIVLPSGQKQTTFKGWPLYYYAPNGTQEQAGQTGGEGVGGIWFVAKPNYSIMIANYQLTGLDGVNYLGDYTPGDGRTSYLTDGNGNTLYAFAKDSAYNNKFTKPDFSNDANWPIYETENITVPSILDKSLFVVTDFHGRKQLSYNGWPLYYFGADNSVRGMNKGISVPPNKPVGSVWRIIKKDVVAAPHP
jgi:predicted lipoprotein with Yx(FWY)xxD motif